MAILKTAEEAKSAISAVVASQKYPSTAEFKILEHLPPTQWMIVRCGLFPLRSPGAHLSKVLKTDVLILGYDENSDFLGYDIFRQGTLVESLEFCEAFPDCSYEMVFGRKPGKIDPSSPDLLKLHFVTTTGSADVFVTFESTLTKATKKAVGGREKFIDQRFKQLTIRLPSKI